MEKLLLSGMTDAALEAHYFTLESRLRALTKEYNMAQEERHRRSVKANQERGEVVQLAETYVRAFHDHTEKTWYDQHDMRRHGKNLLNALHRELD